MKRLFALFAVLALLLVACNGADNDVDAPEEEDAAYSLEQQPDDAQASFVSPQDGDTVSSPLTVELEAEGIELAPAGAPVVGEGHLHVMTDPPGCYDTGEIIPGPSDEAEADGHFHLGDGSESREIDLEPGTYDLCVQLADGPHTAFGQTETITVTVE